MLYSRTHQRKYFLLTIILCFFMLIQGCRPTDDQDFSSYTQNLFVKEVSGNTLTLHYTLSNPSSYGIDDVPVTLGQPSLTGPAEKNELNDLENTLHQYQKQNLSKKDAVTLDTLIDYFHTKKELSAFSAYEDPLLPSGGDAGQLPLLFAQFPLKNQKDIEDYLSLLRQMDQYIDGILDIEQYRARSGLFMSKESLQKTISLLKHFITPVNRHFLVKSFSRRLNDLKISAKEKKKYISENKFIIKHTIFPSYKRLIKGIRSLEKKCGKNIGLCHQKNGKKYYTSLVHYYSGCNDSMETLASRIDNSRNRALSAASLLISADPDLISSLSSYKMKENNDKLLISRLTQAMKKDFPTPPPISCRISYIDPSLKDYFAPAFYISAPIDNYTDNTIYINSASSYSDLRYFTTLAHESLPGHLYQTVMSYHYGLPSVRALLDFPGYTEGWATYVELLSYQYSGISKRAAELMMYNQMITISLYASCDLGIHYFGWDSKKIYDFWSGYGITDPNTINEIVDFILSDPGNYLKYYAGFLNFTDIKTELRKKLGNNFSDIKFHRALLQIGPTSFSVIKKYIYEYY